MSIETISEIDFKYYYQFYYENKDKIQMKPEDGIGTHSINKDAVARWIERIQRLENESERKFYTFFANAFASILETSYITFPTFLTTVHAIAEEIFQKMIAENYTYIVFVITGEVSKSNLWVSLLCMDYWNRKPNFKEFFPKIAIVSRSVSRIKEVFRDKKTLLVHFDDMSYSGGQVAQAVRNVWGYDSTNPPKLTSENVHYYLAIPYLTNIAKSYITTHNRGVKVLESTVMIPDIETQIKNYWNGLPESEKTSTEVYLSRISEMCREDWFFWQKKQGSSHNIEMYIQNNNNTPSRYYPTRNIRKGVWAFQCSHFKTLIYFDHKLADDVSTFQKILFFGAYPINTKYRDARFPRKQNRRPVCEYEPLIQGCSIDPRIQRFLQSENSNACRDYIQIGAKPWNIDEKVICPKPFYKRISYSFAIKLTKLKNTIKEEPFIFSSKSDLVGNLLFFKDSLLFHNFNILYPEQSNIDYERKLAILEPIYLKDYYTAIRPPPPPPPAAPQSNAVVNSNNNSNNAYDPNESYLTMFLRKAMFGFYGGKSRLTRRQMKRKSNHRLTRKQ